MVENVKPGKQTKEGIEAELNMAGTIRSNALGLQLLLVAMRASPDDNVTVVHALMQALGSAIGNTVQPEHLETLLTDVAAEVERCARATLTTRVNLERVAGSGQ